LFSFFPKTVGYTQFGTPWYVAPLCIDKIKYLIQKPPEFNINLEGSSIKIENRFDNDRNNDRFYINPGKIVPVKTKKLTENILICQRLG
jgi:beta-glucuronidase